MRKLTHFTILLAALPFIVTGFTFAFLAESFKTGMDICDSVLTKLSSWINN